MSERKPNTVSLAELDFDSQDLQACVAMMQGGSKTFFAASRLLPPRVRTAAIALYAFCRVADDLVDEAAWTPSTPARHTTMSKTMP